MLLTLLSQKTFLTRVDFSRLNSTSRGLISEDVLQQHIHVEDNTLHDLSPVVLDPATYCQGCHMLTG